MRIGKPPFMLVSVGLMVTAIVMPMIGSTFGNKGVQAYQLRDLKQVRTKLVRSIDLLKDNQALVSEFNTSSLSLESLTLSLIETVEQYSEAENINLTQLSVKPNERYVDIVVPPSIRISFTAELQQAMRILPLFDGIKAIADWRPIDIRRCSIERIGEESVMLQLSCAIDVSYFAGVDL